MAQLRPTARDGIGRGLTRCPSANLLARLALLLVLAVLISHTLALTLSAGWLQLADAADRVMPGGLPPSSPLSGLVQLGWLMDIVAVVLAAWVADRWLTAPVARLTHAARALGTNIHCVPLLEQGSLECRQTTREFNRMHARLRQQMVQRDQFVAAVSQDLRAPLARLSQLAQSVTDPLQRQRFDKDIVEMKEMIRTTLDHLSGVAEPEQMRPLDITVLLRSLVEDARDSAQDVRLAGALCAAPVLGQVSALRRCLDNLVGNALRYGQSASISLQDSAEQLQISVHDNGPGLPEAEFEKVLTPYYRLATPCQRDTGGVGLGLASANDIARRHGGRLVLSNHPDGGLVATLRLPRPVRHTGAQP